MIDDGSFEIDNESFNISGEERKTPDISKLMNMYDLADPEKIIDMFKNLDNELMSKIKELMSDIDPDILEHMMKEDSDDELNAPLLNSLYESVISDSDNYGIAMSTVTCNEQVLLERFKEYFNITTDKEGYIEDPSLIFNKKVKIVSRTQETANSFNMHNASIRIAGATRNSIIIEVSDDNEFLYAGAYINNDEFCIYVPEKVNNIKTEVSELDEMYAYAIASIEILLGIIEYNKIQLSISELGTVETTVGAPIKETNSVRCGRLKFNNSIKSKFFKIDNNITEDEVDVYLDLDSKLSSVGLARLLKYFNGIDFSTNPKINNIEVKCICGEIHLHIKDGDLFDLGEIKI